MRRAPLRGCCNVGQDGTFVSKSLGRFNALTDRWEKGKTGIMFMGTDECRAVAGLSWGRAPKHSSTRGHIILQQLESTGWYFFYLLRSGPTPLTWLPAYLATYTSLRQLGSRLMRRCTSSLPFNRCLSICGTPIRLGATNIPRDPPSHLSSPSFWFSSSSTSPFLFSCVASIPRTAHRLSVVQPCDSP